MTCTAEKKVQWTIVVNWLLTKNKTGHGRIRVHIWVRVLMLNVTCNNISALLVGETGVPGENQRPVISHSLSNNVLSSTPRHERDLNSQR
jgi:hypothetical protein